MKTSRLVRLVIGIGGAASLFLLGLAQLIMPAEFTLERQGNALSMLFIAMVLFFLLAGLLDGKNP